MHPVTPKVFIVAGTQIYNAGLSAYLEHVGASDWQTDAGSASEVLVEAMGRLCYKSWQPGLNATVTRVREGNQAYLANILASKHGSVLEHASVSFIFADVSRVFTHELVRHRVGTAISQESLRYVRLTDLGQWLPVCIREDAEAMTVFADTFETLERLQISLAEHFELDKPGVNFETKKEITSAMRRLAPIGLATTIGWTANMRTIRHLLELRTHPSAEEEMRLVFGQVGALMLKHYPNLFQDFTVEQVKGFDYYKPKHSKI